MTNVPGRDTQTSCLWLKEACGEGPHSTLKIAQGKDAESKQVISSSLPVSLVQNYILCIIESCVAFFSGGDSLHQFRQVSGATAAGMQHVWIGLCMNLQHSWRSLTSNVSNACTDHIYIYTWTVLSGGPRVVGWGFHW